MKNLALLFVFFILSSGIKSQSIIAGQLGQDDYYYDFEPDTVIDCSWPYCDESETSFDLNNDGSPDITFMTATSSGAMGGGTNYVKIIANGNNLIASDSSGHCGDSLVKAFREKDTIQSSDTWCNETLTIREYSWMVGYGSCLAVASNLPSYFIGVKIFAGNDTLYGWIQIRGIYAYGDIIHYTIPGYACNRGSVGIGDFEKNQIVHVFPNPCKDRIYIELRTPLAKPALAILSDINGKELLRQPLDNAKSQLDISMLSSGLYILKVIKDNKLSVHKILVQ